jgi:hypothetical protein
MAKVGFCKETASVRCPTDTSATPVSRWEMDFAGFPEDQLETMLGDALIWVFGIDYCGS